MSRAARDAKVSELRALPAAVWSSPLAGDDLRRHKLYWKVPVVWPVMDRFSDVCRTLDAWASAAGVVFPPAFPIELLAAPVLALPPPPTSPEYRAFVERLPLPSQGRVLVIEDKDPSSAWSADVRAYQARSLHYLLHDAA